MLPTVPIAMVRNGKRATWIRSASGLAGAVREVCAVPLPLLEAGSVVVAMSMMEITHRARVYARQQPVCSAAARSLTHS
jgi:hypothetical protein